MNKLILISFLFVCVGYALAGYGSGTPGYYDPWTYYGGYDRYRGYNYPRQYQRSYSYYPISTNGQRYNNQQPRPYSNSGSGGRPPYRGRSMDQSNGRSYNKISYYGDSMYDYEY